MTEHRSLDKLQSLGWDVLSINFAELIVELEFKQELEELVSILLAAEFSVEEAIIKRGGGLADQTKMLTEQLVSKGWQKNNVTVSNDITFQREFDAIVASSTTHEIDHLIPNPEGRLLAMEIEWNNKDEFFDRDFQSIRRLYELNVIDAGIILTRGQSLEDELLAMIEGYFGEKGVESVSDFRSLSAEFIDGQGRERFSFPTRPQEAEINRKTSAGAKTYLKAASETFKSSKFGGTTTNWRQLKKRVDRRDAGRAPILFLGIPASVFVRT
ncbi:BglII/BstYI family type II restriction endonuclease [Shimia sp. SDUM112013]|uniref:BglII/BstYI family type II restriction endonuclease n=1 Tax=Shimia sp. SDUM112013 TaxID=3136160 RepID=UPI0032EAA5DA